MKKTVYKIILLMLAGMQAVPAHAMWAQAARTALTVTCKRTANSHAARSLSSIALNKYGMHSPARKAELSTAPILAAAPTIDEQEYSRNFDDWSTYHSYQYSSNDNFKRNNFNYKPFACGSLISALALYAYASAQQQDCYAQEIQGTEPVESSRRVEDAIEITEPYTYTINLMWVNRKFEADQKYIHPSKTLEELEQNLLNTAYGWAASNPESTVNIWYDSAFLTPEAIQNTQDAIDSYLSTRSENARIALKDVRELSVVQDNPEIFSDKTPVYFRVDLLRLIETIDVLTRSKELTYFIYVDLDAKPMPQDELFDNETQQNLKKYGIVVSEDPYLNYENGFHIMSNQKPNLLTAINRTLIKLNIIRGENALQENFFYQQFPHVSPLYSLSQIVYHSYPLMFVYFLHLEGTVQWFIDQDSKPYDYYVHGLAPFGLERYIHQKYCFKSLDAELERKNTVRVLIHGCTGWLGPTKKIYMPAAKGDYTDGLPDSVKWNHDGKQAQRMQEA